MTTTKQTKVTFKKISKSNYVFNHFSWFHITYNVSKNYNGKWSLYYLDENVKPVQKEFKTMKEAREHITVLVNTEDKEEETKDSCEQCNEKLYNCICNKCKCCGGGMYIDEYKESSYCNRCHQDYKCQHCGDISLVRECDCKELYEETIINWTQDNFTLKMELWNLDNNRCSYSYEFYDKDVLLFSGSDYTCYNWEDKRKHYVDLLFWLSVQIGDTDDEFFHNYSLDQLCFTFSNRCEELKMIAYEIEEKLENE